MQRPNNIYLDVFIAHNNLMGTRHVLQHRNLVINVGKTHEGTQDGLSLDPRRLKKTTQNHQFPPKQRENSRVPGTGGGHWWEGLEETSRLNFFHLSTR